MLERCIWTIQSKLLLHWSEIRDGTELERQFISDSLAMKTSPFSAEIRILEFFLSGGLSAGVC